MKYLRPKWTWYLLSLLNTMWITLTFPQEDLSGKEEVLREMGCSMFSSKVIDFFPKNVNWKGCIDGSNNSDKSGNTLNSKKEEVSLGIRSSCFPTLIFFQVELASRFFENRPKFRFSIYSFTKISKCPLNLLTFRQKST